jgi:hypothetical protein
LKKFSSDFKAVYNAPNKTAAWSELEVASENIIKNGVMERTKEIFFSLAPFLFYFNNI